MTLQQLRYFIQVVKWKSFSKAAEVLHISQPALSKQISNLEKYLRTTLIKRTNKGIELTEQGTNFYNKIKSVIQQLDFIVEETMNVKQLRVGSLSTIGSFYFPSLAAKFATHQFIPVIKSTTKKLVELTMAGELDAVIVQDTEIPFTLKNKLILEEAYVVAMPENHPLVQKEEIELGDLNNEKILLPLAGCDSRKAVLEGFYRTGFQPMVHLELPYDSLLSYTAAGYGITFIPSIQAQNMTQKGVIFKNIKNNPIRRKIYLLARSQSILQLLGQYMEH
jgi:DNA-binding transcriptional LysR family regulator